MWLSALAIPQELINPKSDAFTDIYTMINGGEVDSIWFDRAIILAFVDYKERQIEFHENRSLS